MKSNHITFFAKSLIFAALVAGLVPRHAGAVTPASGKFKLPTEVHWGSATLPKGDYSFSVETTGGGTLLYVYKEDRPTAGYIISMTGWDEMSKPSPANRLVLGQVGAETYVKDLELGCVGEVLHYRTPASKVDLLAKKSSAGQAPEPMPSEM
jgi:hypothetical protein